MPVACEVDRLVLLVAIRGLMAVVEIRVVVVVAVAVVLDVVHRNGKAECCWCCWCFSLDPAHAAIRPDLVSWPDYGM